MTNSILIIVIPLIVAFTMPLTGYVIPKISKFIALLTVGFVAGLGAYILPKVLNSPFVVIIGGWKPPFGINLYFDILSVLLSLTVSLVVFFALIFQLGEGKEKKPAFYMLVLLLVASINGMFFTGDLFNMFVFMEIAAISSYSLVASGNGAMGTKGALKFLVLGSVASIFYLIGIALIYSSLGTLNIAEIGMKFHSLKPMIALIIAISILSAMFLDAEIFPFNAWVGDAYRGAPSSIAAILSGGVALAGMYAILRFSYVILAGYGTMPAKIGIPGVATYNMGAMMFWFGVITVVMGELAALAQKDAKKMLAFSSIGQMGMVLMALGAGSALSTYGAIFTLISHSIAKLLLFLIIGLLVVKTGTAKWENWRGIARRNYLLGVLFLIGALGVVGVPLFSGFWGKFAIVGGAMSGGKGATMGVLIMLAASVVEAVYFMRLAHVLFEAPADGSRPQKVKGNAAFWAPSIAAALIIVVLGVWPSLLDRYIKKIPEQLNNHSKIGYFSTVKKSLGR